MKSNIFTKVSADLTEGQLFLKSIWYDTTVIDLGSYDAFESSYQKLLQYIQTEDLYVCGNAYVFDLISYWLLALRSIMCCKFLFKLMRQVKWGRLANTKILYKNTFIILARGLGKRRDKKIIIS